MRVNTITNNPTMKAYSGEQKPTKRQVVVAMSSLLIPGFGQALNNDWGKGCLFFQAGWV